MTGGFLGSLFAALSFTGALVAMFSFWGAARDQGDLRAQSLWRWMAGVSWFTHVASVVGIIGTLFYLIYTHDYRYHYVWSHSSNELPVYYMISCFWEGQEGSFLLWTFWHAVLGSVVYFAHRQWRDIVLAVIASVNLILASMILGIYVEEGMARMLSVGAVLVPMAYLGLRLYQKEDGLNAKGLLHLGGLLCGVFAIYLIAADKSGMVVDGFASLRDPAVPVGYKAAFAFVMFVILGVMGFSVNHVIAKGRGAIDAREVFALYLLPVLALVVLLADFGTWKIGSSPFLTLADAFKEAPVFASNPDFVPANGKGLNPLLQNYWMVIHPPTLFLGFASTVVPFAFVIGGLVQGKYTEWVRPAAAWVIFSVAILGVGIIMGGYWAYETLNFGGYWNWDPVENSSLVPWVVGIAALHGMVAYRKSRSFLAFTMAMVLSVFLMVLYSTFLTRSGILGETSVHTFTDLGLSGQLLVFLFAYLFLIGALFVARVNAFPSDQKGVAVNSAEFLVFLGVITLIFVGLVITIFTSLPVFNKVLGTNWAPPSKAGFFYYRWTVYFAVSMAVLSGFAQFKFWKKLRPESRWNSIMRPYMVAAGSAIVVLVLVAGFTDWQFSLDDDLAGFKDLADNEPNALRAAMYYIRWGMFIFADEITLAASLFMVYANTDILLGLLRRNARTRTVTGGSIAHLGFGLMLLGIYFSSGYDSVLSVNSNPDELSALPQNSRNDNVLLLRGKPRNIKGFQVTYLGKKEAVAPISDLRVIQDDPESFKVSFADSTGDIFAFVLPKDVFTDASGQVNLPVVEAFLNDKLDFLKPKHINERSLYGLRFVPRTRDPKTQQDVLDEAHAFVVYPEAEVNPSMGLLAHPSRKIYLNRDVYVHVSTVAKEDEEPQFKFYQFDLAIGDTAQTGRSQVFFDRISADSTQGTEYELIARAHLRVVTDLGDTLHAEPVYRIDKENRVTIKDAYLDDIYTSFAFVGVNTETGKVAIQAQEQLNPPDDIVVIQAIQKPWINLLWLGTFVLTIGFGMAIARRIRENRAGRTSSPELGEMATADEALSKLPDEDAVDEPQSPATDDVDEA